MVVVVMVAETLMEAENHVAGHACRGLIRRGIPAFVPLLPFVEEIHHRVIGILCDIRQGAAPGLGGRLKTFDEGILQQPDFLRIAAYQGLTEVHNPLGGLLDTPITVLGDGFLSGGFDLRIHGVVALGNGLPERVVVVGTLGPGNLHPLLGQHILHRIDESRLNLGLLCLQLGHQLLVGLIDLAGAVVRGLGLLFFAGLKSIHVRLLGLLSGSRRILDLFGLLRRGGRGGFACGVHRLLITGVYQANQIYHIKNSSLFFLPASLPGCTTLPRPEAESILLLIFIGKNPGKLRNPYILFPKKAVKTGPFRAGFQRIQKRCFYFLTGPCTSVVRPGGQSQPASCTVFSTGST